MPIVGSRLRRLVVGSLLAILSATKLLAVEPDPIAAELDYNLGLHGIAFPLPIIIDFDGTVKLGIGVGGVPFTGSGLPFFLLAGDREKKIYKLPQFNRPQFNVPANNARYKVIKRKRLDFGAGMSLSALLPANFALYATIVPKFGGQIGVERHVATYADTENIKFDLPYNIQDLLTWELGDTVSFSARLGIFTSVGLGYTIFLRAGAVYTEDGELFVRVEKVAPSVVQVSMVRNHATALGGIVKATVAIARDVAVWRRDRVYGFRFDLSVPAARSQYLEFLRGHLNTTRKMAKVLGSGVQDVSYATSHAQGHAAALSGGIPLVALGEFTKGKITTATNIYRSLDRLTGPSVLAYIAKTHATLGVATKHLRKVKGFYSMARETQTQELTSLGTYKWFYEKGASATGSLYSQLNKIRDHLGLLNIGRDFHRQADKGQVRLELSFDLTQEDLSSFGAYAASLSLNEHKKALDTWLRLACERTAIFASQCTKQGLSAKLQAAKNHHLLKSLLTDLEEMRQAQEANETAIYAKHFAHFGYHLFKNPVVLHYFLSQLGHHKEVKLQIMGERFEPFLGRYTVGPGAMRGLRPEPI